MIASSCLKNRIENSFSCFCFIFLLRCLSRTFFTECTLGAISPSDGSDRVEA